MNYKKPTAEIYLGPMYEGVQELRQVLQAEGKSLASVVQAALAAEMKRRGIKFQSIERQG